MLYLLFIFYSVLLCWLISRIKFFKKSGLSTQLLLSLFIIRIIALLVSCYANEHLIRNSDSLVFQQMGIDEFNLLFSDPHQYFINFFHNPYPHGYSRIFEDYHSFWNNIRNILIAKMLSVFDFFSFKNFWINTLFFNFLVFFGCVGLYRVFSKIFPKAFYSLIFCIFLLPSALFYSSMIHRDGLIFLSVSMIVFHFYFFMKSRDEVLRRILLIVFFLIVIFLLRNFVFLALLPALIAWYFAERFFEKPILSFVIIYSIFTIAFFVSSFIPSLDFPGHVVDRQESFIEIGKQGNSTIAVNKLKPGIISFIKNAPAALNLALMRPYLTTVKNPLYAPFAIEVFLLELLLVIFLFFHKKLSWKEPVIYFNIFFSLTILLMAGYIVPIIGAIVRYRSIYFVFLFIPIVCSIDWQRIQKLCDFQGNKQVTK
ncbi:MAG: hypothetical protein ACTHK8_19370 [Ginsengibacter sp.]